MSHEYRVEIKVRNNLFIKRIEHAGYKTIGEFCRINHLNTTDIGEVISMKRSPLMANGKFKVSVQKAADILQCAPDDLFTDAQLHLAMKTNKHCLLVNEAEMKVMLETQLQPKLLESDIEDSQRNGLLEKVLNQLSPRESKILRMRFGLDDGIEHTLEEISKEFGCTRTRIRDIEQRAMRRLRHPAQSAQFREFLTD